MPVQIDRIDTEIDVIPDQPMAAGGIAPMFPGGGLAVIDDVTRQQLRALIVGIIEEELERLWRERR